MKNPMKQVTIKGHTYDDIVIIDGSIVCQSKEKDLIFEDGYTEVCEQLKEEWWSHGGYGNQRDYVLEYETESILEYVKDHEGIEAVNNLN